MLCIPTMMSVLLLHWSTLRIVRLGSLNDFVQFTPIQPYAATLRTVVDLYALPFGHLQIYIVNGALHVLSFPVAFDVNPGGSIRASFTNARVLLAPAPLTAPQLDTSHPRVTFRTASCFPQNASEVGDLLSTGL